MSRFAWLLLPLMLFGCSPEKTMHRMMASGEQQRAERLIDEIARGQKSTPGILETEIASQAAPHLAAIRAQLPPPHVKIKLLHYKVMLSSDRVSAATYQLSGGGRFALAEVVTRMRDGKSEIIGFHVQRINGPAESQNPFTLADKSVGHFAMLLAMVAAVGIMVAALIRIWRSGHFRRRWLWTIGALFGFGTFALNWTTGQFLFQPLTFNVLIAGFIKQPIFAPWILKFGIPVVAIIALLKYRGDYRPPDEAVDPI